MSIGFADRALGGVMVTDIMSVGGENLTVNMGMPVESFGCDFGGERILGMNRGKSSFVSQAYRDGLIDGKVIGFCGSRVASEAFVALGSDASVLGTNSFRLYDGDGLATLTNEYNKNETFIERARNISENRVETEHYYTILESVQIGNDSFGNAENPSLAMLDSGWTTLGLPSSMIQSIISYINQTLIENGMDDKVDYIVNDDINGPQGCIRYNATQYPDAVELANIVFPIISITIGQEGTYVPINLTETAFYANSVDVDTLCPNIQQVDRGNIMLGIPFFLDRYVQLDLNQNMGYVSNVANCKDMSSKISRVSPPENTSSFKVASSLSLSLLFASLHIL